ncbi:unnamed protein product [marine sediment metagenome]|uniref:Uncharacterized protein n=1 Tax=marine sediment metagenome TaxID=412755 RepID=X1B1Z4_9ZZZZ
MELSEKVLDEIVSASQGIARTALVLLDKISNLDEEERIQAIEDKIAQENEAIELCRALIKREPWPKITGILKNLKGEPESIRWAVIGYARAVLLKTNKYQAYLVISCFKDHFYDSKNAGLIYACYEAVHGE